MTGIAAPSANAYWEEWYCGFTVSVGYQCSSSGLHSLYYNLAIAVRQDVVVGQYMYNGHLGVTRGDYISWGVWYTERIWNRTSDPWYNSKSFNNDSVAFFLDGYTKTG